jgi:hypothetical protein
LPVELYLRGQPQYAQEREALLALIQSMGRAFSAADDLYLLAANVSLWRQAQVDALVLMQRAIVLLEFKSCAAPVYGRADSGWHILPDGEKIRGGNHLNPYRQIVAAREMLIKYLDRNRHRFLSSDRARETDGKWGQISAAIVFYPQLPRDSDIILPSESRAWLGIIGLNEVVEFLFTRGSPQINLHDHELRCLAIEVLKCQPWSEIESLLTPATIHGYLWMLDGEGKRTYALPITEGVTIGRSRDNGLVVPRRFGRTSRHHARLEVVGDTVWLYDAGSTHGTSINRQPLAPNQGHLLQEGDSIILGRPGYADACPLRFERRADVEKHFSTIAMTTS